MRLEAIGHIESPYLTKFGVPRQPGLARSCTSRIIFDRTDDFDELSVDIVPGTRIIVIWGFSHNIGDADRWSKTVRPPLLGGTRRIGVFATRSSYRPNGLAISCVEVTALDAGCLAFYGGDMVDGTPIFGLHPYDEDDHGRAEAREGWRATRSWPTMDRVIADEELVEAIPADLRRGMFEMLRQDPRPAYTRDSGHGRVFWTVYDAYVIWFSVDGLVMRVLEVRPLDFAEREAVRITGSLPPSVRQTRCIEEETS